MHFERDDSLSCSLSLSVVSKFVRPFLGDTEISSFRSFDRGWENLVLVLATPDGAEHVLRISSMRHTQPYARSAENFIRRETDFVNCLYHQGFPVPRFYRDLSGCTYRLTTSDPDFVRIWTVMSRIPGRHAEYNQHTVAASGEFLRKPHRYSALYSTGLFGVAEDYSSMAFRMIHPRMKDPNRFVVTGYPTKLFQNLERVYLANSATLRQYHL